MNASQIKLSKLVGNGFLGNGRMGVYQIKARHGDMDQSKIWNPQNYLLKENWH